MADNTPESAGSPPPVPSSMPAAGAKSTPYLTLPTSRKSLNGRVVVKLSSVARTAPALAPPGDAPAETSPPGGSPAAPPRQVPPLTGILPAKEATAAIHKRLTMSGAVRPGPLNRTVEVKLPPKTGMLPKLTSLASMPVAPATVRTGTVPVRRVTPPPLPPRTPAPTATPLDAIKTAPPAASRQPTVMAPAFAAPEVIPAPPAAPKPPARGWKHLEAGELQSLEAYAKSQETVPAPAPPVAKAPVRPPPLPKVPPAPRADPAPEPVVARQEPVPAPVPAAPKADPVPEPAVAKVEPAVPTIVPPLVANVPHVPTEKHRLPAPIHESRKDRQARRKESSSTPPKAPVATVPAQTPTGSVSPAIQVGVPMSQVATLPPPVSSPSPARETAIAPEPKPKPRATPPPLPPPVSVKPVATTPLSSAIVSETATAKPTSIGALAFPATAPEKPVPAHEPAPVVETKAVAAPAPPIAPVVLPPPPTPPVVRTPPVDTTPAPVPPKSSPPAATVPAFVPVTSPLPEFRALPSPTEGRSRVIFVPKGGSPDTPASKTGQLSASGPRLRPAALPRPSKPPEAEKPEPPVPVAEPPPMVEAKSVPPPVLPTPPEPPTDVPPPAVVTPVAAPEAASPVLPAMAEGAALVAGAGMALEPLVVHAPPLQPVPETSSATAAPAPLKLKTPAAMPAGKRAAPKMADPLPGAEPDAPEKAATVRGARKKKRRLIGTIIFYFFFFFLVLPAIYLLGIHFGSETRMEGQVIPPTGTTVNDEVWIVTDFRELASGIADDLAAERAPKLQEIQERQEHVQRAQADIAAREERIRLLQEEVQATKDSIASVIQGAREASQKVWDGPGADLNAQYNARLDALQQAIAARAKSLNLKYQPDNTYRSPEVWANAYRLALYQTPPGVDGVKEHQWIEDQLTAWRAYTKTVDDRQAALRQQATQIQLSPTAQVSALNDKIDDLQHRIDSTLSEEEPIKTELEQAQADLAEAQSAEAGLDAKYYAELHALPESSITKRLSVLPNGRFSWPHMEKDNVFAEGEKTHSYWIFACAVRPDGRRYWSLSRFSIQQNTTLPLLIGPDSFMPTKSILRPDLPPDDPSQQ